MAVTVNDFIQLARVRHNFIPTMPWESHAAGLAGIPVDLLRFAISFFTAVLVGAGVRLFRSPTARNLYCLLTGLFLIYYPFGNGALHTLPPAILTYLVVLLAPKHCGYLAWMINFPYLITLHSLNASGSSWSKGELDITGALMVMVLKLISFAVARQDAATRQQEAMNEYQRTKAIHKAPGPLEYFGFIFALGNLLSGPAFELNDYLDFIYLRQDYAIEEGKPQPSALKPGLIALGRATASVIVYFTAFPKFNPGTFFTDYYRNQSFLGKLAILYIAPTVYRYKYYYAWGLSESSLIFAGFSFKRDGDKVSWDKYANAFWWQLETTDSYRRIPVFWNVHTGNFLRRYVYDRLTPKNGKPNFLTLAATQFVSAIWHGLFPGYTLFFISSAMAMHASTCVHKWEQNLLPAAVAKSYPWHWFKVAYNCIVLNYLATSFMILNLWDSLEVWGSVYYFPHILLVLTSVAFSVFPGRKKKPSPKSE